MKEGRGNIIDKKELFRKRSEDRQESDRPKNEGEPAKVIHIDLIELEKYGHGIDYQETKAERLIAGYNQDPANWRPIKVEAGILIDNINKFIEEMNDLKKVVGGKNTVSLPDEEKQKYIDILDGYTDRLLAIKQRLWLTLHPSGGKQ